MLLVVGSIGCRSSSFSSSHESRIRRLLFQLKYRLCAPCEYSCRKTAADEHEGTSPVEFMKCAMLELDSRCLLDGTAEFRVLQPLLWVICMQQLSHAVRENGATQLTQGAADKHCKPQADTDLLSELLSLSL